MFKIVSFFTAGTPYEEHAGCLVSTLRRFDLPYEVDPIEPAQYWEWNCAKKPGFIRRKLAVSSCPVVWLDADATVEAFPTLFLQIDADFAVHKWDNNHFGSGTLYFARTAGADQLLWHWERRAAADPATWDQKHLEAAWTDLDRQGLLTTEFLPRSYLQIFDKPEYEPPVIKHWQASRAEKLAGRALKPLEVGERRAS